MHVVAISTPGGPDVLTWSAAPDPQAGPDELVVQVAAAGVNRADLMQREGHYPPPPGAPPWPGLEVSGTVAALGPGVSGWQVGDRVCALLAGGGYAERVAVPVGQVLPVPDGVGLIDAAALPEAAATVLSNLDAAHAVPGETLLVRGGSGGVGTLAVQLGAALGLHVLATAGGPERVARVRALGAQAVLDHREPGLVDSVRAATGGRGVDVLLDVVGAAALADNLAMLADDGRLVVIGLQRGARATLDLGRLLAVRGSVLGTTLRARPAAQKAAVVAGVRQRVWPSVASGAVRPVVHDRLPMAQAAVAHARLAGGEVFGKLLLVAPGAPAPGRGESTP